MIEKPNEPSKINEKMKPKSIKMVLKRLRIQQETNKLTENDQIKLQ
jgi:hypothetical protein